VKPDPDSDDARFVTGLLGPLLRATDDEVAEIMETSVDEVKLFREILGIEPNERRH
jgi:hypothetical protein